MGHGSKKNPTTFAKRKSRAVIAKMLVKRRKEIRDNDKVEKNDISSTCFQNSISSDDTITDDVFATKSMSPINKPYEISGRRIVDIGYLFSNLKSIKHEDFGCSFFDVNTTNEKHLGLKSIFTYECNMCGQRGSFSSENSDDSNINNAAVCGSIAIGIGQSQF
jgi:hypothetical protein